MSFVLTSTQSNTALPYIYPVCTIETLKQTLKENGVAVLEGVVSLEECRETKNKMFEWLQAVPKNENQKVFKDKPETWKHISRDFYAKHGGLLQHFSVENYNFFIR